MNPYRIYREKAADALRRQAVSAEYRTFVAMPFRDGWRYRARRVFRDVISAAAAEANASKKLPRHFAAPERVDRPHGAVVITEEIVLGILEAHIFLGDLTRKNTGVILETGIAMGMKPARQIVLITQEALKHLHFDLRNNNVIRYSLKQPVSTIAEALIDAARHFEEQVKHYLLDVRRRLSPDSLAALLHYATIQQQNRHYSLHPGSRGPNFPDPDGHLRFEIALSELRAKDLVWTDYAPGAAPHGDAYGVHATDFGWAIIQSTWPHLPKPSE